MALLLQIATSVVVAAVVDVEMLLWMSSQLQSARPAPIPMRSSQPTRLSPACRRALSPQVDQAVKKIIAEVGLTEKVNVRSHALSGGMKRKLSVAIALIGDSKVVFLGTSTLAQARAASA